MQEEITKEETNLEQPKTATFTKFKSKKVLLTSIIVVAVVAALFFSKGIFVAAVVNGSPVSRLSVILELEKQGGKNTLESLITEKLIENEAKKKGVTVTNDEVSQEVKNIETSITQQGSTLNDVLLQRGMTMENLQKQIEIQKKIEKLLVDKIQVTDEEVTKFIEDNKTTLPTGNESETKAQVTLQLKNQKLDQEVQAWIAGLKAEAKISYFVNY